MTAEHDLSRSLASLPTPPLSESFYRHLHAKLASERALPTRGVGSARRRLRRALVFVVVGLACAFTLSAVAAETKRFGPVYWLFDRSEERFPLLQVPTLGEWSSRERVGGLVETETGLRPQVRPIPVLHGDVAGKRWELQAFFETRNGWPTMSRRSAPGHLLCVGLNPGGTPKPYHGTDVPRLGAFSCGQPVHGVQPSRGGESHWVGFGVHVPGPISAAGGGTGPKYLFGTAAPEVRRVDLESNDGTVVSVPTFLGPSDFGVPARFWVSVLRLEHLVHTLVPRDAEGNELERWELPQAQ